MKTQLEELKASQLQQVTEAIVKAVPEIVNRRHSESDIEEGYHGWCRRCGKELVTRNDEDADCLRPILFEDVLRAACAKGVHTRYGDWKIHGTIDEKACFYAADGEALGNWTLGQPLSSQPPETIAFLHSLLIP